MPTPTPSKKDPRPAAEAANDQYVEMEADDACDPAEGDYAAKLIEFNTEAKSNAGAAQWEATFFVPDANKGKGRKMKVWLSHSEAARWKLTSTMKALGVTPVDGKFKFKPADILGTWVLATVKHELYKDELSAKIVKIVPAGPELIKKYADKPSA